MSIPGDIQFIPNSSGQPSPVPTGATSTQNIRKKSMAATNKSSKSEPTAQEIKTIGGSEAKNINEIAAKSPEKSKGFLGALYGDLPDPEQTTNQHLDAITLSVTHNLKNAIKPENPKTT